MQNTFQKQSFSCITDYALEIINAVDLEQITHFFDNLIGDQYLEDNYRFRRLSRFKIDERPCRGSLGKGTREFDNKIVKLPHNYLFQSSDYNPILGDVVREYPEIEAELIKQKDFKKIILEFYEFCKLCSQFNEIAVHQIRTITSESNIGEPAPEGVHQDGVDLVGIFCVNRENITGGVTKLSQSKNGSPVLTKILNPGEFLVFADSQFWHYTSPITTKSTGTGVRDVFVLTCPGLLPPAAK
ncbi:2OG-Fe dioxygenase family protein [Xenococcus sp. PCC 7305]|uniref:2OG-Fe dioxygenase family protein n=1 Tax=Xenococcus sp. PCC 7305 TaxID=102125 RepID=UPI0002EA543B|nr:2OG-Fe dioxygenase family protein [Xenococcus sp. PCC 7305]